MNTLQLDRTKLVAINPPRNTQTDLVSSLDQLRARFTRNDGLPFAEVLNEPSIRGALDEHGVQYRDRLFNPVTTVRGFLSQVLSDDHSCRDAVARIIAQRAANAEWKWNGRSVFAADGSHVSMPDTPENQAAYPQPPTQEPGVGFPLARACMLLSLATGACHDLAIAPYAGKGTGETTLLREMYGALKPGDVVLADALFDNYFLACELRDRGLELVARVQAEWVGSQTVETRPDGDIILWRRPNKPRGMTGEQYRRYARSRSERVSNPISTY